MDSRTENKGDAPTETFKRDVSDYIRAEKLLLSGDTVVVAVSGGADSIALLDVLSALSEEWRLTLHIAHLNHGLRGDDSDQDALFVETLAHKRRLMFHTKQVACHQIARAQKRSIEETARIERRNFLLSVAGQVDAQKIATGHHMDDQAETVLLRLLRGSGTTGLAAIRPIRENLWIRPLLDVRRTRIDSYVRHRGLSWKMDASNLDVSIPRNRIRNQLLPILKSDYAGQVAEALARAAEILRSDDDLLESITLDASKTVICARSDRKIALDGIRFFGYHVAIQRRLIRGILTGVGLDPRRVEFRLINRLLTQFRRGSGSVQISSDLIACTSGRLILLGECAPAFEKPIAAGRNPIESIDAQLTVDPIESSEYPADFAAITPFEIWFDRGALPPELVLRAIKPGDRIRPFGSGGSSKVSHVLINQKIPRLLRDEVPVLAHGSEVFWIVGIRASETSRISATSNQALRFRFEGSWRNFLSAIQRNV